MINLVVIACPIVAVTAVGGVRLIFSLHVDELDQFGEQWLLG